MTTTTTTTAFITETHLIVVASDAAGRKVTTVSEDRPSTFAAADTALAFHSMARTGPWELSTAGSVSAPVATDIDNRFNGTVAARLAHQAVSSAFAPFELVLARTVQNGDLISDAELSTLYVVAGSSFESGSMKIHMVAEGKTWEDRYTSEFPGVVMAARKR